MQPDPRQKESAAKHACTVGDAVYLNEQTQHVSNACDRALLMLECTLKNRQHVG